MDLRQGNGLWRVSRVSRKTRVSEDMGTQNVMMMMNSFKKSHELLLEPFKLHTKHEASLTWDHRAEISDFFSVECFFSIS